MKFLIMEAIISGQLYALVKGGVMSLIVAMATCLSATIIFTIADFILSRYYAKELKALRLKLADIDKKEKK